MAVTTSGASADWPTDERPARPGIVTSPSSRLPPKEGDTPTPVERRAGCGSASAPGVGGVDYGALVVAIDPGPAESAWCVIDGATRRPVFFRKAPNATLRALLRKDWHPPAALAIEMIQSYGMPVGAEVFDTAVWIGRFVELSPVAPLLIGRTDVKLHHCLSRAASDANIKQALIDRFASGVRNHGKGTKSDPGWFYGFRADVWQAYALAVYVADMRRPGGR